MKTDYLRNSINDWVYRDGTPITISSLYLGLSQSSPNRDGSNFMEPAGNNYQRIQVTRPGDYSASSNGTITNAVEKTYNIITPINWGILRYWGIFDGPGEGTNLLEYGPITNYIQTQTNTIISLAIGDFVLVEN